MKPIVGLIALYDDERDSYWMLPGYMKALEEAGVIPVMLPLTYEREIITELVQQLDGFVITGGQDVNPLLYQEDQLRECGQLCSARDQMEELLLNLAMQQNKPVLGICRGLQMINVALGGSLYQDLPTQTKSSLIHEQMPPYDEPSHTVMIEKGTPLAVITGEQKIEVNSLHHQGIKQLAPSLVAMAVASDGLIEAVYHPQSAYLLAVQWHPECSYLKDSHSRKIFQSFTKACFDQKSRNVE